MAAKRRKAPNSDPVDPGQMPVKAEKKLPVTKPDSSAHVKEEHVGNPAKIPGNKPAR